MNAIFIAICLSVLCNRAMAQPEDYSGIVAGEKWTVLHLLKRPNPTPLKFNKQSKVKSLDNFQVIGPMPGHPFVLGNFAVDGEWGLIKGYIQRLSGHNAAMEFGWADQFELEGIAEHADYGGWFLLMGYDEGRGHAIINVNMKNSGSPWFISKFRGDKAIEDETEEFPSFDWKREQTFKLTVQENTLSLTIGKFKVFEDQPLDGYASGRIIFGVNETKYGTKPIRFKSLRLRALPKATTPESVDAPESVLDE